MLNNNLLLPPPPPMDFLIEREFIFPESLGDFNTTANYSFPSTLDGDPVVLTYNNFTINSGHTVTTTQRCKGLYLYIKGNLTVNGTLSMTARGANAEGRYVAIDNENNRILYSKHDGIINLFDSNKLIYPTGGVNPTNSLATTGGAVGAVGKNGACGAGGSIWIGQWNTTTALTIHRYGGNGTSFSGGPGAGGNVMENTYGSSNSHATKGGAVAGANGGAGGTGGYAPKTGSTLRGGGGAGNPGGVANGTTGTGGLLILIVEGNISLGSTGYIRALGSAGGKYDGTKASSSGAYFAQGGCGSGGGAIHIIYKGTITNQANIQVTGGAAGTGVASGTTAPSTGYAGGNGTINLVKI